MKKIQVDPESRGSVQPKNVFGSNSSKTTTPSKSLKHRFKVKKEFKDDHAFEEFEDESQFNDDNAFQEFEVENEFDRVQKFVRLIFIYYKSEANLVWKFRQDQLREETVRISQLYEAKSEVFICLKFDIYLDLIY